MENLWKISACFSECEIEPDVLNIQHSSWVEIQTARNAISLPAVHNRQLKREDETVKNIALANSYFISSFRIIQTEK